MSEHQSIPTDPVFVVGTDPAEMAQARDWLSDQLDGHGVMDEEIDELRLALTEVLTNLLQHATPRTKSELSVTISADRIDLMIADDSAPFAPGTPTQRADTPDDEAGFGLLLLHMLVDEVESSPGPQGGSIMRLSKQRVAS